MESAALAQTTETPKLKVGGNGQLAGNVQLAPVSVGGNTVLPSSESSSLLMKGGDGAADYMIKVAGDMGQQVAGNNGSLQYSQTAGSADLAVPAGFLLASQLAKSYNGGKRGTRRNGKKNQSGGLGITEMAVPVVLVLASNAFSKNAQTLKRLNPIKGGAEMNEEKMPEQEGGAAPILVPAALLLANTLLPKAIRKSSQRHFKRGPKKGGRKGSKRRQN